MLQQKEKKESRSRQEKRKRSPSSSSFPSSSSSCLSTESENEIVHKRFRIVPKGEEFKWNLPSNMTDYANLHFKNYFPDKANTSLKKKTALLQEDESHLFGKNISFIHN